MLRGSVALSKGEERALRGEAARIAECGDGWTPTEEALREVVETVKEAGEKERREAQKAGISAARERGVRFGRPRKARPESFPQIVEEIERGRVTRVAAARELGVSCETLRHWMAERP